MLDGQSRKGDRLSAAMLVQWDLARCSLRRRRELAMLHLAHRAPRWLRYWITIDSIARATTGKYGQTEAPALRAMDVLDRI